MITKKDVSIDLSYSDVIKCAGEWIREYIHDELVGDWTYQDGEVTGNDLGELTINVKDVPPEKVEASSPGGGNINITVPVPEVTVVIPESPPRITTVERDHRGNIKELRTE